MEPSSMMPYSFEACLPIIYQFDGFKDDRAPGETFATAYGVTQTSWNQGIEQGLVPNKPIEQATQDDCTTIIRVNFWNASHASQLPPGVNLMVFNDAVLCGVGHATRLLQRILGVPADGIVGPITIRAASAFGDKRLIDAIHDGDDEYFAALKNAPLYLKGWTRREDVMQAAAYKMTGISNG